MLARSGSRPQLHDHHPLHQITSTCAGDNVSENGFRIGPFIDAHKRTILNGSKLHRCGERKKPPRLNIHITKQCSPAPLRGFTARSLPIMIPPSCYPMCQRDPAPPPGVTSSRIKTPITFPALPRSNHRNTKFKIQNSRGKSKTRQTRSKKTDQIALALDHSSPASRRCSPLTETYPTNRSNWPPQASLHATCISIATLIAAGHSPFSPNPDACPRHAVALSGRWTQKKPRPKQTGRR